jgi:two-component system, chemotaxis family, response regulator Rcp1
MSIEVLLVEDSPGDARLMEEAFHAANRLINIHVACDGEEAMSFLRHEGANSNAPRPDIIILDLNLPTLDGREVLARIKEDDSLGWIPVFVLTTSDAEADIITSYQNRANCYHTKPLQWDTFQALVKSIHDYWLTMVRLPQQKQIE